tara:strand:- start:706 stop:1014 length:309 start_codon:yes stop_codon:yes gene_type:complete
MGGKKISSYAKEWIDKAITHEPKPVSKIIDDIYSLMDIHNRTMRKSDKGYRTGRHIIPTKTELQAYLSKNYESVTIKNNYNPVLALHYHSKVRHYFRKEEHL